LAINVQDLETAEACSEHLKTAAGEANKMAASAVGYGQMAIRYAIKAGEIMSRAKEILPHGEFLPWLNAQLDAVGVTERTARRWTVLANRTSVADLMDNPKVKTITDAYRATGILPEPEQNESGGEGEKEKPSFTLAFKTRYKHTSEWSRDDARDFLYEFERIAKYAVQLKTEFGL
jgi:hypothetical protein